MSPEAIDGAAAPDGAVSPKRKPYDHQVKALVDTKEAYRAGKRAIVLVCPTGGGKTFIGSRVCDGVIAKGGNVLWLAHREELIKQAARSIMAEGFMDVGIIAPWASRKHARVQVASVQTLLAQLRKGRAMPNADVVVADECHHYPADDWSDVLSGVRDRRGEKPFILGLTATPERSDGKPMGDMFDCLIPVSSVQELQALGILVPCVTYRPDSYVKALSREPVQAYQEHGAGERCFVFCLTVPHAESEAALFRAAGYPAATIHANTPWRLREAYLRAFQTQDSTPLRRVGSTEEAPIVLTNVYTLTEGVDVPEASVAILARGFGHQGLLVQVGGRVIRAAPWIGKERAIIWDLRGVTNKLKTIEEDRTYSLEGKAITPKSGDGVEYPKKCHKCEGQFMTWRALKDGSRVCPSCGERAPALTPPEVREREVFAVGRGVNDKTRREALERCAIKAVADGKHPGWVRHRMSEMHQVEISWDDVQREMVRARKLLGIKPDPMEVGAERARLEDIAREKRIPMSWVIKKLAEKFGEDAA